MIAVTWKIDAYLLRDWKGYPAGTKLVIDKFACHPDLPGMLFVHVCEPWKSKWLPDFVCNLYKRGKPHGYSKENPPSR